MEDQTETKDAIRRRMREMRKALTPEKREQALKTVCGKLIRDGVIADKVGPSGHGEPLAVYLASPDEIDLSDFISKMLRRGVNVVAPRWNGETYELARLKSLSDGDLRRGPMNILEPAEAETVDPADIAVWIIPGLAFTDDGRRLGYGGGWYDRLLASARKGSLKIGVAHEFQIVGELPREPHDISLDRITVG